MELTSSNVEKILIDCFVENEECEGLEIKGIVNTYIFDPDRLKKNSKDITDMLNELPKEFHKNGGGGWSFLQACNKKNGVQWTDLHQRMEELFVLGMGIKKVKSLFTKDMWPSLSGGMPYYVIY